MRLLRRQMLEQRAKPNDASKVKATDGTLQDEWPRMPGFALLVAIGRIAELEAQVGEAFGLEAVETGKDTWRRAHGREAAKLAWARVKQLEELLSPAASKGQASEIEVREAKSQDEWPRMPGFALLVALGRIAELEAQVAEAFGPGAVEGDKDTWKRANVREAAKLAWVRVKQLEALLSQPASRNLRH